MSDAGLRQLCVHGHFYQPPRQDPFSGSVPREPGAEPYNDFNEKIAADCYRPNAVLGNFSRMSFDLGPTLATWLEHHDRTTYRRILAQERLHYLRHGASNAIAQVYNHAIMPLATERERRIQVAWGLADYAHRFQHPAPGIWLAETAADLPTLSTLADFEVGFTILSPWQATEPVEPGEPYLVELPDGRAMTVFFYNGPLSGGVSFNENLTSDAVSFTSQELPRHLDANRLERGERQLVLVATDGELYGHHHPLRQHFLAHLLTSSAPAEGFEPTGLAAYLSANPPRRSVALHDPSSWSCTHGVDRWSAGCACTEGDSSWKGHLRQALSNLARGLDAHFEAEAATLLGNPWEAEQEYLQVRLGAISPPEFLRRQAARPYTYEGRGRIFTLLEGQFYRHLMFASCAFFFDDLDRLEPRYALAHAARALLALPDEQRAALTRSFASDLAPARSWRTPISGGSLWEEIVERSRSPLLTGAA